MTGKRPWPYRVEIEPPEQTRLDNVPNAGRPRGGRRLGWGRRPDAILPCGSSTTSPRFESPP